MAQSSCDNLFQEGQQLQKNMTAYSQRQAISKFERAKVCYDSQERKNICDQQIQICRNIIKTLEDKSKMEEAKADPIVVDTVREVVSVVETKREDVVLSLSGDHLKFDDKAGDFQKIMVICNYDDWKVSNKPEWITIAVNGKELVIEASENPDENERAGVIEVSCGEKHVNLVVSQEKRKQSIMKKINPFKKKKK